MILSKEYIKINGKEVGNCFIYFNETLTTFQAPKLQSVGDRFLFWDKNLTTFQTPLLQSVGDRFLYFNKNKDKFLKQTKINNINQNDTIKGIYKD